VPALTTGDVVLGENTHRGKTVTVRLSRELRLRHAYVIGATGTGKSTLLKNLIRQDIEAGKGVGVLDPHGDLVEEILGLIPEKRHRDVVLFDPSDEEFPIGFNILWAHTSREKDLLASDLAAIFRRFSTSWGDQMTAVLGNAILAFLESEQGGTLVDLRRFLVDRSYREELLQAVADSQVHFFWRKEFPLLAGKPQVPILTRLDAFLRPKALRMMVAQKESKLDLARVIDEGKIFLGKLAQGAIGEENAHLLGSLLVAKFHQMALGREGRPPSERRDFFLYLDEFHHFRSPSLGAMLAESRKYHVGLVLAHQELKRLGDTELQGAVLTNPATRICFRLGDDDARKLAEGFSSFQAADLQSLGVGEALCRIERADQDFNLQVPPPTTLDATVAPTSRAAITQLSRAAYGSPRAEVDKILEESLGVYAQPQAPAESRAPAPSGVRKAVASSSEEAPTAPVPPSIDPVPPQAPPKPRKARPAKPPRKVADSHETSLPGKGGPQHKYFQSLLKHFAEQKGFQATVEAEVPNGGHVDLLLARDGAKVAVEISISSTPAQEIGNVQKCLAAEIPYVVVLSPDRRALKRIQSAARDTLPEDHVFFLTPEDFLVFLDEFKPEAGSIQTDTKILGYRVRTRIANNGHADRSARMHSIAQTILAALRRLKQ